MSIKQQPMRESENENMNESEGTQETVVRDTAQFAERLAPAVSPVTGPRAEVMRACCPARKSSPTSVAWNNSNFPSSLFMSGEAVVNQKSSVQQIRKYKVSSDKKSSKEVFQDSASCAKTRAQNKRPAAVLVTVLLLE